MRALGELAALSVLCGLLWRAEVAWHGWEGLVWVGYFHWALPAGVLLFRAWVLLRSPARPSAPWQRWLLGGVLPLYAAAVLYQLELLLGTMYSRMFFLFGGTLEQLAPCVLGASLAPVGAFLVGWLCGARLWWPTLPLSWALYGATFPLGIATLEVLGSSHADLLHAIKTGAAVPFAVFAFGLPWAIPTRPSGST